MVKIRKKFTKKTHPRLPCFTNLGKVTKKKYKEVVKNETLSYLHPKSILQYLL